ncbi:response regulator transcription factor [Lentzea sp.]|uniref:response regulator transcription factor n=1 Tax=Lentzea sp. TaxID=56099 RepID=UPI002B6EA2D2|nr:response regulator transcription factor [Lentzea sp.]HUQ60239.1 response regulator transcription factor [Lentzea sp.]
MANALVVEDHPAVRGALARSLLNLGHAVRAVSTAAAASYELHDKTFDLVLVDLGLPERHCVSTLRQVREITDIPILVATARSAEACAVSSLNAGADDHLVKPISDIHLGARVNALLRRHTGTTHPPRPPGEDIVQIGKLTIDFDRRQATVSGAPITLTRREYDLLAYLARHLGRVITRRELLTGVWGHDSADTRSLDVHCSWLRRKLGETAAKPAYLHTIHGVGYKLTAPPRQS